MITDHKPLPSIFNLKKGILSCFPIGEDALFDAYEEENDFSSMCLVNTITEQIRYVDAKTLIKESNKNPTISNLMKYVKDCWPQKIENEEIKKYKKLENFLSVENA